MWLEQYPCGMFIVKSYKSLLISTIGKVISNVLNLVIAPGNLEIMNHWTCNPFAITLPGMAGTRVVEAGWAMYRSGQRPEYPTVVWKMSHTRCYTHGELGQACRELAVETGGRIGCAIDVKIADHGSGRDWPGTASARLHECCICAWSSSYP